MIPKKKSVSIGINFGKGKILSKPKVSIQKRDILNSLKKSEERRLVREERIEDVNYNRSVYFNEEFRKEKKDGVKWLN